MPGKSKCKFGEHREELVSSLTSELSSKKSLTSQLLKPEQTRDNKSDELLKDAKSPTNFTDSKSDDPKHDGYYRKATLNSRGKGSRPEREDVYFGSISKVWNYCKDFCIVSLCYMNVAIMSSSLLLNLKIPLAGLLGLDVDSIIAEWKMYSEAAFTSCNKRQNECELLLNIGICIAMWLCSLVFQILVHPIVSYIRCQTMA